MRGLMLIGGGGLESPSREWEAFCTFVSEQLNILE